MKRDMTLKRKWLAAMLVAAALSFSVGQQAMAQTKQAVVVGSSVTAVKDGTADAVSTSDKTYVETTSGNTVTITTAAPPAGKVAKVTVGSYTVTSAENAKVHVTALTVTGAGGTTIVDKGSTLQMTATVAPTYADWQDVTVTWSITSGSDYASINTSTGVLTGTAEGDVVVTATATDGSGVTGQCTVTVKEPFPVGDGKFSVSSTQKVYFAKGNLQATYYDENYSDETPGTWSWAFATNQWEYIGGKDRGGNGTETGNNFINGNGTLSENGTVDLFRWVGASSSFTGVAQYGITNSADGYGNNINEALKSDWGNIIGTGTGWRTLTEAEWNYLLNTRTVNGGEGAGKSYTYEQKVNDVYGLVIYPDNYTGSAYTTGNDWSTFEAAGCIFLPTASYLGNEGLELLSYNIGCYWSSSPSTQINKAKYLYFQYSTVAVYQNPRNIGFSVRLVKNAN